MTENINNEKSFPKGGRAVGAEIIVELYIRKGVSTSLGEEEISEESKLILPGGEKSVLLRAASTVENDHLSSNVGRVLSMGPRAFKAPHWDGYEPGCAVGDWVLFDHIGGIDYQYLGTAVRVFHDSNVRVVLPDPSYVTRN